MVPGRVRLATLRAKHAALAPVFTERSRRLWAASEARALGHGGIGFVDRAPPASGIDQLSTFASMNGCHPLPGSARRGATHLSGFHPPISIS